jgi:hypothetical protein
MHVRENPSSLTLGRPADGKAGSKELGLAQRGPEKRRAGYGYGGHGAVVRAWLKMFFSWELALKIGSFFGRGGKFVDVSSWCFGSWDFGGGWVCAQDERKGSKFKVQGPEVGRRGRAGRVMTHAEARRTRSWERGLSSHSSIAVWAKNRARILEINPEGGGGVGFVGSRGSLDSRVSRQAAWEG